MSSFLYEVNDSIPLIIYIVLSIYLILTIWIVVGTYTQTENYIPARINALHTSITGFVIPLLAYTVLNLDIENQKKFNDLKKLIPSINTDSPEGYYY